MCTAVTYLTKDFYFGRTLDYDCSFGEQIAITPREFPLMFRHESPLRKHYAMIGMAHVAEGYPLYYDAVNEKGLCMAGLNFEGNAEYGQAEEGKTNVAQFELIPWLLSRCATVKEARMRLKEIHLTGTSFNEVLPPAKLHWMIADREEAITVESVKEGLKVYDNPAGVLTNNPPFEQQMFLLNRYMHLSVENPENTFSDKLDLKPYSEGMGAIGLPGDVSSPSRFVRAAFVKLNSVSGEREEESVSQFFHILGAVEQVRGCNRTDKQYELTYYTSCCNAEKGIYYYTTYDNHQINAVELGQEDLSSDSLLCYPLRKEQQIYYQNAVSHVHYIPSNTDKV